MFSGMTSLTLWILVAFFVLSIGSLMASADPIADHFFGENPTCARQTVPVILATDVSTKGEIDDTISLYAYRRLEQLGCIKVIAVVSIFGNSSASTETVHANLLQRLEVLGIDDWTVLAGPNNHVPFTRNKGLSKVDRSRLDRIADVARRHDRVVIVELGPFTISACLIMHGMIDPSRIERIVGVGGREPGESFSTGAGIPFAFRDMNVAEDREAIRYLVRNFPGKLWLVTYRTGIGSRMVRPEIVGSMGVTALDDHARARARRLKLIGYGGLIPLWDTWTTSYFLDGQAKQLGCQKTRVGMRYSPGFKPTDSLHLQFLSGSELKASVVTACHEIQD